MKNLNIKEQNYWAIHDAFLLRQDERIQGSKLEALHRLIQRKGELLNLSKQKIKGLHLGNGTYIAMEIEHLTKNSFFPCKIKKIHLQKL